MKAITTQKEKDLVPEIKPSTGIVGLADKIENLAAHFNQFETLKEKLLNKNDYYKIKTKNGYVDAIGKSGWYKFAVAFNLSTYIIKEEKEWLNDTHDLFAYHLTVQASAPNGRNTTGVGSCDNTETDRAGESIHVIRAMAETRALERAIISMVGAPEKANTGSTTETPQKTNSEFCECIEPDVTPDKGGCRNCRKALSPEKKKMVQSQ